MNRLIVDEKVKVKSESAILECGQGAYLPFLGLEPQMIRPLKSVMHGQCNARPMVTFPAADVTGH